MNLTLSILKNSINTKVDAKPLENITWNTKSTMKPLKTTRPLGKSSYHSSSFDFYQPSQASDSGKPKLLPACILRGSLFRDENLLEPFLDVLESFGPTSHSTRLAELPHYSLGFFYIHHSSGLKAPKVFQVWSTSSASEVYVWPALSESCWVITQAKSATVAWASENRKLTNVNKGQRQTENQKMGSQISTMAIHIHFWIYCGWPKRQPLSTPATERGLQGIEPASKKTKPDKFPTFDPSDHHQLSWTWDNLVHVFIGLSSPFMFFIGLSRSLKHSPFFATAMKTGPLLSSLDHNSKRAPHLSPASITPCLFSVVPNQIETRNPQTMVLSSNVSSSKGTTLSRPTPHMFGCQGFWNRCEARGCFGQHERDMRYRHPSCAPTTAMVW